MKCHWDRPGWWPGRRAYYWYLTFGGESELREIAATCQAELSAPYFDPVRLDDLHMTLERIAFDDEINEATLTQIAAAAADMCRKTPTFSIYVGPLAGSSGAISFSASPYSTIAELRSTLDAARRSVLGRATNPSDSTRFRPHIGIAYCNETVPADQIVDTVQSLRELPIVEVRVRAASIVTLTREQSSYRWIERRQIPLGIL